jgi:hypothetical protein
MHSSIAILLLASCAVFHSATAFPGRAVLVKTSYGTDNFYIIVPSYAESVGTTKELIAKKIGLPAVDQTLVFNHEEMATGKSLSDYGVDSKTNPILYVAKREEQAAQGDKVNMLAIMQGKNSYYINLPNADSTTIIQVKEIIAKKTGLPTKDIVLEFSGAKMVQDTYTLADYGVTSKTLPVLFVSQPRFNSDESIALKVYYGNQFFDLAAGTSENVGSFKEQVRTELQKAMSFSLTFNSAEITRDDLTLVDYGVTETQNPVIHAAHKKGSTEVDGLVLTVHHGERRFQIITASSEKIIDAKATIERIVGITAVDQTLSFNYDEMQNELTFSDYGITSSANNHVVYLSKEL